MEAEAALPVPDDTLADILGRLPPCALAASRCVCKSWRALVDARALLLPHLLPHALRGIFINYSYYKHPVLFARPSPPGIFPRTSGDLGFVPGFGPYHTPLLDHCNGLLLYLGSRRRYYVINPATRQWESFPSPRVDGHSDGVACLVFDPAVSPQHYELFRIPRLPDPDQGPRDIPSATYNLTGFFSSDGTLAMEDVEEEQHVLEELARPPPPSSLERGFFPSRKLSLSARWRLGKPDDPYGSMEWPPSPCTLHVFSSSTRRWEERQFVREGDPVGTVEGARWRQYDYRSRYGIYWQETLYVHCRGGFVMRFSLKLGKYQVIKTPEDIEQTPYAQCYLARSIGGVCFAVLCDHQLQIWNLNDELTGKAEWTLKHRVDFDRSALWAAVRSSKHDSVTRGSWMLRYSDIDEDSYSEMDDNTDEDSGSETYADSGKDCNSEILSEEQFHWDSGDDCVVNYEDGDNDEDHEFENIFFLGFHPYREVVFLMVSFVTVAYHLRTSKIQWLGKSLPRYYSTRAKSVKESFPYTPCMIGDLLNH